MINWIARFALPIVCCLQLVVNLRLGPEASPRRLQQILEQTNAASPTTSSQVKMLVDLSASASSSLLLYNLALSAVALMFCIILLREEAARHKASGITP